MDENQALTVLRASLLQEKSDDNLGLSHESDSEILSRIQSVQKGSDKQWFLHLASDGLNLENKMGIESVLMKKFHDHFNCQLAVDYRPSRVKQALKPSFAPLETQVQKTVAPFGLKVNRRAIPGVRDIITVASGKGGVGKSTLSTQLAIHLATLGQSVGLLDADIYGPSAPTMLGIDGPLSIERGGKINPPQALGIKCISFGFLSDAYHPVMWRGPLLAKTMKQFLYDVKWGNLDTLVVDLPPGTGDIQLSLLELIPIHGAIIVTTPQDVALIDAHKALTMFEKLDIRILGLVENMAYYRCRQCGFVDEIFGEESMESFLKERNIQRLAQIPLLKSIRLASDLGTPKALEQQHQEYFSSLAQSVQRALA